MEVKVSIESLDRARPAHTESGEIPLAELFTGCVAVDIPGFEERQKLRLSHIYPSGKLEGEDGIKKNMEYQAGLIKMARDRLKGVDLKLKDSDESKQGNALNVEQIEQYEVCGRFYEAVAFVVMKGVPLGKS